jgi:hypothetical protein
LPKVSTKPTNNAAYRTHLAMQMLAQACQAF